MGTFRRLLTVQANNIHKERVRLKIPYFFIPRFIPKLLVKFLVYNDNSVAKWFIPRNFAFSSKPVQNQSNIKNG